MNGDMSVALDLTTICEGELNNKFKEMYPEVVKALANKEKGKGSVGISINFQKVANTDTMFNVDFTIKKNVPAEKKVSICQITGDNTLKTDAPEEKVLQMSLVQDKKVATK